MNVRDLVRVLSDGQFHSGEQLGEMFGVSRTAIWKQLQKLEALGITIEAVRGRGYRVARPMELLDGGRIVADLPRDARQQLSRLFVESQLESTNTFLLERFAQGAGHAEVCVAEVQTAGRGRRGRSWHGSWGAGIHFSLGWCFESGVAAIEGLSLAIGVSMAELLQTFGVDILLKWPNDLLVEHHGEIHKLGGILTEVRGDMEGPCEVVIGIGLNVAFGEADRQRLEQSAAGLHELVPGLSRNALISSMIDELMALLPRFERQGFGAWQADWNARHYYTNRAVVLQQGSRYWEGIAQGVNEQGNLAVRIDDREVIFSGGEISLRASG
ncbi:BirA family biotin operon repressor/biotin-[acetyl-CoA-carboxylase] ligase [Kushneria sinocarnis]|uniref:Bifunctional ligase/repressor BirA n=1 Tax=Kushneria sinocarnis TaxID=595502 RepID=A0A420WT27_9GAMM|nr:biotin--[acetyl-CoA-carboxylase] ligase [Kushneria sinocarnis]RKQ95917.1 BirA family biotin operon repressor/biotin-[acetyl-CoA-carboxylase] ligase [Kushneria sinocarnis]